MRYNHPMKPKNPPAVAAIDLAEKLFKQTCEDPGTRMLIAAIYSGDGKTVCGYDALRASGPQFSAACARAFGQAKPGWLYASGFAEYCASAAFGAEGLPHSQLRTLYQKNSAWNCGPFEPACAFFILPDSPQARKKAANALLALAGAFQAGSSRAPAQPNPFAFCPQLRAAASLSDFLAPETGLFEIHVRRGQPEICCLPAVLSLMGAPAQALLGPYPFASYGNASKALAADPACAFADPACMPVSPGQAADFMAAGPKALDIAAQACQAVTANFEKIRLEGAAGAPGRPACPKPPL